MSSYEVAPPKRAPKSKAEFYERYQRGEFGNRPRSWPSWEELRDSGYAGRVSIRDPRPMSPCYYGVDVRDLLEGRLPEGCAGLAGKKFNESMPDELLTIQGQVWYDLGLKLEYSRVPSIQFRAAVTPPNLRTATGVMARSLLTALMDPYSYDDLQTLFELYPEAVVEFSTYSANLGVMPSRNTVFWEVREY